MVSITVSVSEQTRELMKQFPEMNWSGLIKKTIEEKAKELSWKEEMLKKFKEEEEFTSWAIKKTREGRVDRVKELKSKGLI